MPDPWKQISDLYHSALELPESERATFLQASPASDRVRREVASLLANERAGEHLLESPALKVAAGMTTHDAPVLMVGQTLSHYQIIGPIGRGGMGEVYRAHDGKLGRDVAIKTLPPEFACDPGRVARFNREAKLLASLNHPNIAAIYGMEESGGTSFLVLELAEGQALADRIRAGPIPPEEALGLALQIAEALEAAHEKGVIHRDLKPANIQVTPDGKVKVLDFGLAKAFAGEPAEANPTNSPALSAGATRQGIILGTAAYMSPEQAKGKVVDKRTDVWAFGCVLFEMLAGRPAFAGDDVSDILAGVIRGEPDWTLLPANLDWRLRETIEICLRKDAKDRYHDIADVRVDIQKTRTDPNRGLMAGINAHHRAGPRTMLPWVSAAIVLTAAIAAWAAWRWKPPEPRPVIRSEYILPEGQQFNNLTSRLLEVSPDGTQFVHVTADGLYLRSLDDFHARFLVGTGTNPSSPFFSPDGKWVGYCSGSDSKLKKVAVSGGEPMALCDVSAFAGASWGPDGWIVYAEYQKEIKRVSASGGIPEVIVREAGYYPQLLPDGRSVLFTSGAPPYQTIVQSLPSGERKELFEGDSARYLATKQIVYAVGSSLLVVPFDLKTLKTTGRPVPVVEGIWRVSDLYTPQYAASDSGTLCYIPATPAVGQRTLVWVDRNGQEEPLAAPPDGYSDPRIFPDGTRVALSVASAPGGDIWIWDLIHRTPVRLTFEKTNAYALWTPDGRRVAYWSAREGKYGAYWKAADGTGKDEPLGGPVAGRSFVPASWAANGKILVATGWHLNYMSGIGMLSMEGDRRFKFLLDEKYHESQPRISPDGRWMAYTSMESGKEEIYVRSFPDMNGRWQVSTNGGNNPLWSRGGREICYRNGNTVIAVSVRTSPAFVCETPRTLFQGAYVRSVNSPGSRDFGTWDISPDGRRFLMLRESSAGSGLRRINIVLNWSEELKQRMP